MIPHSVRHNTEYSHLRYCSLCKVIYLRNLMESFTRQPERKTKQFLRYKYAIAPPLPANNQSSHSIVPTSVRSQVTASGSRRSLAATGPAQDPTIFPNGGTYYDPIAVSLVSDDGAIVFYTTDGTMPDEASSFVTSSELIILEESATIRAIAAYGREYFDVYSSAEVEASFAVYTKGVSMRPGRFYRPFTQLGSIGERLVNNSLYALQKKYLLFLSYTAADERPRVNIDEDLSGTRHDVR